MKDLLSVDIGHLLISTAELNSLVSSYSKLFKNFQTDLREGRSPLTLSFLDEEEINRIKDIARELREKYESILVLGIGGSALGTRAILQFLKGPYYNLEQHSPSLFVLDNIDPAPAAQLEGLLDLKKTALVYTSKSGSTPETAANFIYFYRKYQKAGGSDRDIVIICDPGDNGINQIARNLDCHLLHFPPALQGRFSVLSAVGFLPSELVGIDCRELLAGASAVHRAVTATPPDQNPLFLLGLCLYELGRRGKSIHVLFNYSNLLVEFGLWFMQLWGESLGKRFSLSGEEIKAGTTPLACTGATDQHSLLQLYKEGPDDKTFGFVKIDQLPDDLTITGAFPDQIEYSYFEGHTMQEQLQIEQLATEVSLAKSERPCYRITLRDNSAPVLGALFYFYEALTVLMAGLYGVNPYDQPGVEEGKRIAYALLGRKDYQDRKEDYQKELEKYRQGSCIYGIKEEDRGD
jgi:glucose-6-phosphate isomerase